MIDTISLVNCSSLFNFSLIVLMGLEAGFTVKAQEIMK